jgi:hypothetical protein
MRLFLVTSALVLVLVGTALARPAGPDPQRAPGPASAVGTDLRAPDQVAPAPAPVVTSDLRAPDQQAPPSAPPNAPAPSADGGPAAINFVLIGGGAALLLLAAGYFTTRWRHRLADADDLVASH